MVDRSPVRTDPGNKKGLSPYSIRETEVDLAGVWVGGVKSGREGLDFSFVEDHRYSQEFCYRLKIEV